MTGAEMEKIWNNLKRNLKSYCDENGFSDVMLGLSAGWIPPLSACWPVMLWGRNTFML